MLFTFVPVTPRGIGQRELVFSMVYGLASVRADVAVAASVTSFAPGLVFPFLGGALTLWHHARPASRPKG